MLLIFNIKFDHFKINMHYTRKFNFSTELSKFILTLCSEPLNLYLLIPGHHVNYSPTIVLFA